MEGVGEPKQAFESLDEEKAFEDLMKKTMDPALKEHRKATIGSLIEAQDHRVD